MTDNRVQFFDELHVMQPGSVAVDVLVTESSNTFRDHTLPSGGRRRYARPLTR